MVTLVLDTGALIALDRGERGIWVTLDEANSASRLVQVRDPPARAPVAADRSLRCVPIHAATGNMGRDEVGP